MHADEVSTDAGLVRRLLADQFPRWAGLAIEQVPSSGTDNALYRLGDDLVARLPRIHWAAELVDRELECVPRLAPHLPVEIPVPVARGAPGHGYPWTWSVCPWLDGEHPVVGTDLAADLGRFVATLHAVEADGPPAGRGGPLAERDESTRAAIAEVDGSLVEAWEAAVEAPAWERPPVWLHGDLMPTNLLRADGRLSAVLDWGCCGIGDPAVDLIPAWNLLPAEARDEFRKAAGVDDATWARGRGWALSLAVGVITYYRDTNPVLAGIGSRVVSELRAESLDRGFKGGPRGDDT